MIDKSRLEKVSEFIFRIPKTYRKGMHVDALIFATSDMLEDIIKDRSLEQLINVTYLPGIRKAAVVMPDVHEGYGFPIGAVAALGLSDGVISPGGIGYDINCGVRLLLTKLTFEEVEGFLEKLGKEIFENVPAGIGENGFFKLDRKNFARVLNYGVSWAAENGFVQKGDQEKTESSGSLTGADDSLVSDHAKERGIDQLGTMGAGNHFVEIGRVETIYNPEIAQVFGLFANQITVLIHTGSRGLGHQVATDYIRKMIKVMPKYKISISDLELSCVPVNSPEGKAYFSAMQASANFAWTNRQLITYQIRKVFRRILGRDGKLAVLYDVAHNIAKIEEYEIHGIKEKVLVHRKGATRAFGPSSKELPQQFRQTGQPVIIPGSMGTASFVLCGTDKASFLSFSSTCHGAGRRMSRKKAKRITGGKEVKEKLQSENITVLSRNVKNLSEEAPYAYKDIEGVVEIVDKLGIAGKVARLKPLVVIKG